MKSNIVEFLTTLAWLTEATVFLYLVMALATLRLPPAMWDGSFSHIKVLQAIKYPLFWGVVAGAWIVTSW